MPRNGSGVYTLPAGNPVITGTVISSTTQNNTMSDVAAELTNSIAADGQKVPTANLPMGGFRHTGVLNANARDQYAAVGQVQDSAFMWCGTAAGTANALTFSPIPAITAYAAGQVFRFQAGAAANTAATTVAISGLAAIDVEMNGAPCIGNEIAANNWYELLLSSATKAQLSHLGDLSANLTTAFNDKRSTVALTATTSPIWTAGTGKIIDGTGTPTITDFPAAPQAGAQREIYPPAGATMTHGGNISVQGNASVTAAAGDKWVITATTITTFDVRVSRKDGLSVLPVINRAYSSYTANADLSTTIPFDDTIPQINEGTQILSVTLTPKFTTSRIRLRFQGDFSVTVGVQGAAAALFDGSASAISSRFLVPASTGQVAVLLEHEYVSGVTSAITYTLRVGAQTNSIRLNGSASARLGGGSQAATLIAEEILV